ncbi:MAG TPA: hypothetical protein VFK52_08370 [Nocardioidaceae bacterium]|nr:hypothetical protein [Nocardioidaceae bacterium]
MMRTHPRFRALTVATVLGATLVATALPAQAARLTLSDPAGDTWTAADPADPAGSARNTDLRRTVLVHAAKRLTVRSRYVDLVQPRRGETLTLAVRIRVDDGPKRNAFVIAPRSAPYGRHRLVLERNDAAVRCDGMRHRISYARDVISLSIPRTCLGRPRWVQLMVVALDLRSSGAATIDDAASTGPEASTWTRRLRRG